MQIYNITPNLINEINSGTYLILDKDNNTYGIISIQLIDYNDSSNIDNPKEYPIEGEVYYFGNECSQDFNQAFNTLYNKNYKLLDIYSIDFKSIVTIT